ncbi:Sulfite oxidase-like oxidoreductase [Azospirillaceae bacterium]
MEPFASIAFKAMPARKKFGKLKNSEIHAMTTSKEEIKSLFENVKIKLIESKKLWAKEGRGLTGDPATPERARLPPGQHEVKNWPILDLGVQPSISLQDWSLTIDGAVRNPTRWTWDEFQAQPRFTDTSDMHCVTTWSRFNNHWEGVSAKHILEVVQPLPEASHVVFTSYDGYTTNLRRESFEDGDVLVATHWERQPISIEHGGPARIIIPKIYLWKSAKWVRQITFLTKDQPGFWEVRGYHNEGDPWLEERYS